MFVFTVLKIGFGNTILADLKPAECKELYNNAVKFLTVGKFVYRVEGDIEAGIERVRFWVFNICVSDCMKLATLMLQHTFAYLDLANGEKWLRYTTTEAAQQKLRANLQSMTIDQFKKKVYENTYVLFYRSSETPIQVPEDGLTALRQDILAYERLLAQWCEKNIQNEIRWSLDETHTASSRYFSRCKLWSKVFSKIQ